MTSPRGMHGKCWWPQCRAQNEHKIEVVARFTIMLAEHHDVGYGLRLVHCLCFQDIFSVYSASGLERWPPGPINVLSRSKPDDRCDALT